jgi:hypothetical protein
MASITGKTNLFFVTSPRSPHKMRDEVKVLVENFGGQLWESNRQLQEKFYRTLAQEEFFTGSLSGELDFKGRDRITRGPKALGLVELSPTIQLTNAGEAYLYGKRPHEIFTRQLLKFQLPSPYHIDKGNTFFVKPYLELLRLIDDLGSLSKDEIAAFVIQLTDFQKYDLIKTKIEQFRMEVSNLNRKKTNYRRFFQEVFVKEVADTYATQIASGQTLLRESREQSAQKFINTKARNHIDYADAAIRYLRETRLVSLTGNRSNRIHIPDDKKEEVKFILDYIPREPVSWVRASDYTAILFDAATPILYGDNSERLIAAISSLDSAQSESNLALLSLDTLKDLKEELTRQRVEYAIEEQVNTLQLYTEFDDIEATYSDIKKRQVFDAPLLMEWNTWRAFVMLDDGEIKGNFVFDDAGYPLVTAAGNQADIVCAYGDFDILVEVTLSKGAKQYEMEGEPVARHLGNYQKQTSKDVFCIFIAPNLHPATLSHFYLLHQYEVAYYGGKVRIIPLSLNEFQDLLKQAYKATTKPTAQAIKSFVQSASELAQSSVNETEWYRGISQLIVSWVP